MPKKSLYINFLHLFIVSQSPESKFELAKYNTFNFTEIG